MLRNLAFFVLFCFFTTTPAQAGLVGTIDTSSNGIVANNPLWSFGKTQVSWEVSPYKDSWKYVYTFQIPSTTNSKPEHVYIGVGDNFQRENILIGSDTDWNLGNLVIAQKNFHSIDLTIGKKNTVEIISNRTPKWGSLAFSSNTHQQSGAFPNNLWAFNSNFWGSSNKSILGTNQFGLILVPGDETHIAIPIPNSIVLLLLGLSLLVMVVARNRKTIYKQIVL